VNVTIYALCCPLTSEARYVGKTINLYTRVRAHLYEKSPSYKKNWITSLKNRGLKPSVKILEVIENSNDEDWQERERWWIHNLKQDGCRLTNKEEGGLNGKIITDEVKAKISAANKGRKPSPLTIEMSVLSRKGKHHSPESIRKMKLSHAGKRPSKSCIEAGKIASTGRVATPDTITKLRASALLQGPRPKSVKDKISKTLTGRSLSDSHRRNLVVPTILREMKKFLKTHPDAIFEILSREPQSTETSQVDFVISSNPPRPSSRLFDIMKSRPPVSR